MRLTLLAAVAANGTIGRDNDLPWHIPEDLRRFRRLTLGRPVLMGRRTHQSILARRGRPLDGRLSIVVSATLAAAEAGTEGVVLVRDVEAAIARAAAEGAEEAFVIGGAGLYAATLARADRLDLARIDIPVAGDVRFPHWDPADWILRERQPGAEMVEIDGRPARYAFEVWDRRV